MASYQAEAEAILAEQPDAVEVPLGSAPAEPPRRRSRVERYKARLLLWTCVGVLFGFLIGGFGARPLRPFPVVADIIGLPGHLFLRALQALVLPLVVSSLVSGVLLVATSAKDGGRAVRHASICV